MLPGPLQKAVRLAAEDPSCTKKGHLMNEARQERTSKLHSA